MVADKLVVTIDEPQPSKDALLLAGRNAILATLNEQGRQLLRALKSMPSRMKSATH